MAESASLRIEEATIDALHAGIKSGRTTCVAVVAKYIGRARAYNEKKTSSSRLHPRMTRLPSGAFLCRRLGRSETWGADRSLQYRRPRFPRPMQATTRRRSHTAGLRIG